MAADGLKFQRLARDAIAVRLTASALRWELPSTASYTNPKISPNQWHNGGSARPKLGGMERAEPVAKVCVAASSIVGRVKVPGIARTA